MTDQSTFAARFAALLAEAARRPREPWELYDVHRALVAARAAVRGHDVVAAVEAFAAGQTKLYGEVPGDECLLQRP